MVKTYSKASHSQKIASVIKVYKTESFDLNDNEGKQCGIAQRNGLRRPLNSILTPHHPITPTPHTHTHIAKPFWRSTTLTCKTERDGWERERESAKPVDCSFFSNFSSDKNPTFHLHTVSKSSFYSLFRLWTVLTLPCVITIWNAHKCTYPNSQRCTHTCVCYIINLLFSNLSSQDPTPSVIRVFKNLHNRQTRTHKEMYTYFEHLVGTPER